MTSTKTKDIVMTALMAALVFVATYLIRIPNPATGGYSHLGDCMIFLAVVLMGRRNGALAAAIGGGLSDFLAGAPMWILPTLVKVVLIGTEAALLSIPNVTIQTTFGIVIFMVLSSAFSKSLLKYIKKEGL